MIILPQVQIFVLYSRAFLMNGPPPAVDNSAIDRLDLDTPDAYAYLSRRSI